jgi:hypothetical protein
LYLKSTADGDEVLTQNAHGKYIEVKPHQNLFTELGRNTYDYVDLLSELIDNAIAARLGSRLLEIKITLGYSKSREKRYFKIQDNASGILFEKLGDAVSPGALGGGSSLNEHGLGMKQAIASMGTLSYLLTKTKNSKMADRITTFGWGKLPVDEVKVKWKNGTEICITNLKPVVDFSKVNYTRSYVKILGARYRRFLKPDNPRLSLLIVMTDVDDRESEIANWGVSQVKPVYFHPKTRLNSPVIEQQSFEGNGWEAELSFGYAPTDAEYKELGLEPPDRFSPYHVSINNQGLDVIRNDRIVQFHQLSEIGIVEIRHSDYNYVRGELDLKEGFHTAITKNSLVPDEHYVELLAKIEIFLRDPKKEYLKRKTWPAEISEGVLRKRLAKYLKTRSIDPKKDVKEEFPVGALGGSIDVLADKEAYEIKTTKADGIDVYQLFAYLDMGDIQSGIFIAPDYSTGAMEAAKHIENKHKKKITLAKLEEFPINQPLTKEEM